MTKIHTRVKRRLGLSHNLRHKLRPKKVGAKTFKTEESAKRYAEAKGIKNYTLSNLKLSEGKKKLKIIKK